MCVQCVQYDCLFILVCMHMCVVCVVCVCVVCVCVCVCVCVQLLISSIYRTTTLNEELGQIEYIFSDKVLVRM